MARPTALLVACVALAALAAVSARPADKPFVFGNYCTSKQTERGTKKMRRNGMLGGRERREEWVRAGVCARKEGATERKGRECERLSVVFSGTREKWVRGDEMRKKEERKGVRARDRRLDRCCPRDLQRLKAKLEQRHMVPCDRKG